jgi:hypothetical protein
MMTRWRAANISTAVMVLLLLSFLCATKASLENTWKIDGPHVHLSHGNNVKAFQLQYFVSDKAKFARYTIFQGNNCEQAFEEGTEVVRGNGQVVTTIAAPLSKEEEEDDDDDESTKAPPSYTMTIIDNPSGDGQIASVKLVPTTSTTTKTVAPRSSSMFGWVSSLHSWITGDDKNILHFCLRMGLWLPPEAGEQEVNFRETNVKVTLGGDDGKTIQSVELEARPMNPVQVHILGGKVKSGGDPIQKEDDDEGHEAVEKQGESLQEETEDTATSKEQESVENNEASNDEL